MFIEEIDEWKSKYTLPKSHMKKWIPYESTLTENKILWIAVKKKIIYVNRYIGI